MATIYKRGSYQYEVTVRRRGFPRQFRTFESRREAEAWAATIESEMARGVFVDRSEAERTLLRECIERYEREVLPSKKGYIRYLSQAKKLKALLGDYTLAAITTSVVANYRDKRLKVVAAQTVIHELSLLNRILKACVIDWGIALPAGIPTAAIRKPTKPRGRERRLLPGELDRLLIASESEELEAILYLAVETAMRRSEICRLRWKDVNLDGRYLRLDTTKNGERRDVPLSIRALGILESLPCQPGGHLFSMRPDSVTQAFIRAIKRARQHYEDECQERSIKPDPCYLTDLRLHDLRHEATSRLFEKGLNVMETASVTGHKDLRMLKRYTHLSPTELAKKLG
ncbi:site-specific integrase [Neisseriaceae bacterium JH1-16]|nr:site-specific integrase [Neisseriaceae bacterium JH1-16]